MDDLSRRATRLAGAEHPSRRFKEGRICGDDGCTTRLSVYNDGAYCSLHQPMATPRTRGRKIA